MKPSDVSVRALATALIAAVFGGCGAQNGTALPQSLSSHSKAQKMSASSGDLIYAANGRTVYVFTYPAGEYVTQFNPPYAQNVAGLCSDASGNVFIDVSRGFGAIYEYAHGATTPSATLSLGNSVYGVEGCAAETGKPSLAVAATDQRLGEYGVLLYDTPGSVPVFRYSDTLKGISSVTFVDDNHIFAWCDQAVAPLVLLTAGSEGSWSLQSINANSALDRYGHFIQWDGTQLAVSSRKPKGNAKTRIKRVAVVSGNATISGTTSFSGLGSVSGTTFALNDSTVLFTMTNGKSPSIGIYPYPKGGNPETVIQGYAAQSVTVSVAGRLVSRNRRLLKTL